MTAQLLDMAKAHTWRKIAVQTEYVIREIDPNNDELIGYKFCKLRKQKNRKAPKFTSHQAVKIIEGIFPKIHILELSIFEAKKNKTIIEIAILKKDMLNGSQQKTSTSYPPIINCKVPFPMYAHNILTGKTDNFDINWQLGTFEYFWKTFWYKLKYKIKTI